MIVDDIIIGQGLSGSLLSRLLLKAGRRILVIDNEATNAASRVAGGVINPVTGKRLVRSWLADTLLPHAVSTYREWEAELGIDLVKQVNILDFHPTREASGIFMERAAAEDNSYLGECPDDWSPSFRYNYGIGLIAPAFVIDLASLLAGWREHLSSKGLLLSESYNDQELSLSQDRVQYRHITASRIIFCNGEACAHEKWFSGLPWSRDKGEALLVSIPGLPASHIYKQGITIVPMHGDIFWVGASHDWRAENTDITPAFREATETQLQYWLKLPYTITQHVAAMRPAHLDRKPIAGFHPAFANVGILNGMGGKGVSQAPWCASALANNLVNGTPLPPEIDVTRFSGMLRRATATG